MINRVIKRLTTFLNWKRNKKNLFFVILFLLIIVLFKNAFRIGFFQDDYFFLKISRISSLAGFFNFFSPLKTYSFKPLFSEVFYFLLSCLKYNIFIGHLIVFSVYFLGLVYFFKIIKKLTNNHLLAYLATFMYGVSFIHVFQLYWFATFQEIMVFTALLISFNCFLDNKYFFSLTAFTVALLSKETAILFVPFLIVFEIFFDRQRAKNKKKALILYVILAGLFYFVYQYSLKYVTSLDNYKMQIKNLRLVINNSIWYFLWAIGIPNFMPDVTKSIFFKFLPDFYKYLKIFDIKVYFILLGVYWFFFITILVLFLFKNKKEFILVMKYLTLTVIGFFVFLGPMLYFPHRWMVRLMIPVVFICLFQAYIIFLFYQEKIFKKMAIFLIITYLLLNYFGIKVHESSSNYLFENKISMTAKNYFAKNYKKLSQCKYIYFADNADILKNPWGGSKKLKNSFWGQFFLDYYFPGKKIQAIYSFETNKSPPQGACIINSYEDILK